MVRARPEVIPKPLNEGGREPVCPDGVVVGERTKCSPWSRSRCSRRRVSSKWALPPSTTMSPGSRSADLCRVQLLVLTGEFGLDLFGDAFVGGDTLARGLRPGVLLGHLLHMAAVVLVARPRTGEGQFLLLAVSQQVSVDELGPVVRVMPMSA